MNRTDLADLDAFIVIADHLSFRAASTQLGTPQRCAPSLTWSARLNLRRADGAAIQRLRRGPEFRP